MEIVTLIIGFAFLLSLFLYLQQRAQISQLTKVNIRLDSESKILYNKNVELSTQESFHIKQLQEANTKLQDKERATLSLTGELAKANEKIESLLIQSTEERKRVDEIQANFRNEFKNLANEILEQKSKQFKETNRESMEHILKPFKENIVDFKGRVEQIYSDENQQRGALRGELKNLMELNNRITTETSNLTNALKGNSKVQGDWGEMILETILDGSNLINNIHYTIQPSFTDEQGNRLRPDIVVNLPDNKQIVLDSKVSLTAYVEYANADSPEVSTTQMAKHILSIRRHIDELGAKKYHELNINNSPHFVIMFIPNEAAFLAALQNDMTLWTYAYNKKVILSSPTNLFAQLKLIDDLWKRDNQSKNALEIARQGANLYDKLMGLFSSISEIGRNLEATTKNYDKVITQLKSGSGNLIGRTERLKELGIKTSKALPTQYEDYDNE